MKNLFFVCMTALLLASCTNGRVIVVGGNGGGFPAPAPQPVWGHDCQSVEGNRCFFTATISAPLTHCGNGVYSFTTTGGAQGFVTLNQNDVHNINDGRLIIKTCWRDLQ